MKCNTVQLCITDHGLSCNGSYDSVYVHYCRNGNRRRPEPGCWSQSEREEEVVQGPAQGRRGDCCPSEKIFEETTEGQDGTHTFDSKVVKTTQSSDFTSCKTKLKTTF